MNTREALNRSALLWIDYSFFMILCLDETVHYQDFPISIATSMPTTQESPAVWSRAIQRLHFSVALLVTIQIVIGLVMDRHTSWLV